MCISSFTARVRRCIACTILLLASPLPALGRGCDKFDDGTHCYVTAQQDGFPAGTRPHGVGGLFTEPDDLVVSPPDYSIGQLLLADGDAGKAIEFGWVVNPKGYNDTKPHLFIALRQWTAFSTTRCVIDKQIREACNNKYIDFTARSADGLSAERAKNHPGSVVGITGGPMIYHVGYYSGNACDGETGWWIQYGDEWIGCVKESWWPGKGPGNFANGNTLQWYGEINNTAAICVPMGNGLYGTNPDSASISKMFYETMKDSQSIASDAAATNLYSDFTMWWTAAFFIPNPKGFNGFHYGGPYGGNNSCGQAM